MHKTAYEKLSTTTNQESNSYEYNFRSLKGLEAVYCQQKLI